MRPPVKTFRVPVEDWQLVFRRAGCERKTATRIDESIDAVERAL